MKRHNTIRLLLFALLLTTHLLGSASVKIGDLYYNLDEAGKTATVTYESRGSSGNSSYVGYLAIPSSIEHNGYTYSVTSIGKEAFSSCKSLTSVTIPNSVTEIGNYAFHDCSSLTSVAIPNSVISIGNSAFYYCSSLASVHITDLAAWCKIKFVNGSSNPLYYAHSLYLNDTEVKDLVIPDSVTEIGKEAFSGCSGLTSVTIPNSVTSIGSSAFYYCSGLTSVTIPNSVTSIGYRAFYYCSGLTSVTIPNSVKSIGDYAFCGCSGLKSVTIPNSVTAIGNAAFFNCSGLTSVHITDLAAWCKIEFRNSSSNPLYYANSLYLNRKKVKDLVIPDSVTTIGNYAFHDCRGLTSVTIPNSVTTIGGSAFLDCRSLTSVHITDLAAWCKIKFSNIPSNPLYYARSLYLNGTKVKDLVIPNQITEIGNYAFYECSGLTSVTIPNSVTSIGKEAFSSCKSLTSVHITDLAAWCKIKFSNSYSNPLFYAHSLYINGTEIKDLVIPDSVTSIGDYAFSECSSLKSVTIPSSLASIGYTSFTGCTNLSSVNSYAETPPVMYEDAFSEATYQAATLYVPKGCADAYKDDAVWYLFNTIIEGDYVAGVDDVIAAGTAAEATGYYNLQGVRSDEPWDGLNIVVYSDGSRRKAVY